MSAPDDFYYRSKPSEALVRRQALSLEERGAADTYEKSMHTRDGTLPDEREARGMKWHQTVLGVRNARTVHRLVAALLDCGELVRLTDGRLTSKEVQSELAHRARRRARGSGEGGQGSGGAGGGETLPAGRQLVLIEGGLGPQTPVDEAVGERLADGESGGDSGAYRVLKSRITPDVGRKTQRNQWGSAPHSRAIANQMVVVAESRFSARARGDPGGRWA